MTKEERQNAIDLIYEVVQPTSFGWQITEAIGFTVMDEEEIKLVMIGDVLDYILKTITKGPWISDGEIEYRQDIELYLEETIKDLLNKWNKMRSPIEDQSDQCVDDVYNLIKKYERQTR